MLDLIEKISTAFCGLVVLCVAALYLLVGTGSTVPIESIPKVELVDLPSPRQPAPRPTTGTSGDQAPAPAGPQVDAQAITAQLRKQGVSAAQALQAKSAKVPSSTFEYVQHEANWMKELKQYKSAVLRNVAKQKTRLQLTGGVDDNTLLGKLGFQNGDIVELIDGQMVEFGEESSWQLRNMAKDALGKLRNGEPISVTLTRDGKPLHLVFSLR